MKKSIANNTFKNGLVMDLNPLLTPNDSLTNCLNGTLVTFNGNEGVLQNDMGNGRVETATLPEGYVPLGTTELGGIIYIVSYNPELDLCQIGSFPSPERNITSDEITLEENTVSNENFIQNSKKYDGLQSIKTALYKHILLKDIIFHPGDKFKVYFKDKVSDNDQKSITDYGSETHVYGSDPKNVRIHIASVNEDGVTYLDDYLKWFAVESNNSQLPANKNEAAYIIDDDYPQTTEAEQGRDVNLDKYRNLVSTPYDIFRTKNEGNLCLLFELETIDTFSCTIDPVESTDNNYELNITFYWIAENWKNPDKIFLCNSKFNIENKNITISSDNNDIKTENGYYYFDLSQEEKLSGSKTYTLKVSKPKDDEKTINDFTWSFTAVPAMSFGLIEYLEQDMFIDFSKFGTGISEINTWKYYNNTSTENTNGSLLLNFYSSIYPTPSEKCTGITLTFIPYTLYTENETLDKDTKKEGSVTYKIRNKKSYFGSFTEEISYNASNQNFEGDQTLQENTFYVVEIQYNVESLKENKSIDKYKHIYKTVWTNSIFNTEYLKQGSNDFTELYLNDYLSLSAKDTPSGVIAVKEDEVDTKINGSDSETETHIKKYILTPKENQQIYADIQPIFVEDYNTFKVSKAKINNIQQSSNKAQKTPDTVENLIIGNAPEIILDKIKDDGTKEYPINNLTITSNNTDDQEDIAKNQLKFTISGSITKYTQYEIDNKNEVFCEQVIRPLVYDEVTLKQFGLVISGNSVDATYKSNCRIWFDQLVIISHLNTKGETSALIFSIAQKQTKQNSGTTIYKCTQHLRGSKSESDDNTATFTLGQEESHGGDTPFNKKNKKYAVTIGEFNQMITETFMTTNSPIGASVFCGCGDYDADSIDRTLRDWRAYQNNKYVNHPFNNNGGGNAQAHIDGDGTSGSIYYLIWVKLDTGMYWATCDTLAKLDDQRTPLYIAKSLMQIYRASSDGENAVAPRISSIVYQDPFIASISQQYTFDIQVSSNSSISLIDDDTTLDQICKQIKVEGLSLNNLKLKDTIKSSGSLDIGYGFLVDSTKQIEALQKQMIVGTNVLLYKCDGSKELLNGTKKPEYLYYLNKDNKLVQLDRGFKAYNYQLSQGGETTNKSLKLNISDTSASKINNDGQYSLLSHLILQEGQYCIDTTSYSFGSTCSAGENGNMIRMSKGGPQIIDNFTKLMILTPIEFKE